MKLGAGDSEDYQDKPRWRIAPSHALEYQCRVLNSWLGSRMERPVVQMDSGSI
jgi:hypothetical protein